NLSPIFSQNVQAEALQSSVIVTVCGNDCLTG
ncbi:unnamed protein product, partial [marine sediment metagenome]